MLALYTCGLTANVIVGVTARVAVGVSVRVAARAVFVGIRRVHSVIW